MERRQRIDIFQQGAYGLAGAIDGVRAFILLKAENHAVREDYRGPSMANPEARIDRQILPRYDFDFSQNQMLYSGSVDHPTELQLNSVDNYIAYHLVTLMEQIRGSGDSPPLRAIVMACTHFPFHESAFRQELHRLRNYQEDSQALYCPFMANEIELIDPAYFAARELYHSLAADKRIRERAVGNRKSRGEFYVTIPCREKPGLKLDDNGWFTYEHKYGRNAGRVESDFRTVPLDGTNLDQSVLERLQHHVPAAWSLMSDFRDKK
jgi:hypothetical protein